MTVKNETVKKKCCFYASDFHLEMTIVPYINRKIEENKNIIIVTEKKLEETVNILISKMNIKNKHLISALNWNNNDIMQVVGKQEPIVIINGSKKFVENKNKDIKTILKESPVEVIDCFCFDEIKDEIIKIRDSYSEVINNLQKDY